MAFRSWLSFSMFDVYFVNDTVGFAVGDNGIILSQDADSEGKEGEFYTNKLDIENCKRFEKNEFDKALIDMGILTKDFKGSLMNAK